MAPFDTRSPALSVVIPTRDRVALLAEALESLVRLASPAAGTGAEALAIEVIVVDDRSRADPTRVAEPLGARVVPARGQGISNARNTGLGAARAPHVLFLDDDDVVLPGHVRPHLALLQSRPDLEGAYGQFLLAAPDLTVIGGPYPRAVDEPHFRALLRSFVQIGAFVTRRSVCEEVGPFDASLTAAEDLDWSLRLARRGHLGFVPTPCIAYRQRPEGTGDDLELQRLPLLRRVFWHHARQPGAERPSLAWAVRAHTRQGGVVAGHLMRSCEVHVANGDHRAGRHALTGAVRVSPLHVAVGLLRDRSLAPAVLAALRPA